MNEVKRNQSILAKRLSAISVFFFAAAALAGMRQPSQAQQQAFAACLQQQGVSVPAAPAQGGGGHGGPSGMSEGDRPGRGRPPGLSAEQQAAFDQCHNEGANSRETMDACLQSKGVTPPAPPQGGQGGGGPRGLSTAQQQAMETCRQQASRVQ